MSKRPPTVRPRQRRHVPVTLLACTTLTLTACSSDEPESPTADSTTSTTIPITSTSEETAPTPIEEGDVEQLASRYFEAIVTAAVALDPNHPDLLSTMTGPALQTWKSRIEDLVAERQVLSFENGRPTFDTRSVERVGDDWSVVGCVFDPTVIRSAESGKVVNDNVRIEIQHLLVAKIDSGIRVSDQRAVEEVATC